MYVSKKIFLCIIIILLLLSLYNDFIKDQQPPVEQFTIDEVHGVQVKRIKYEVGETFLSITERLNGVHISDISMEKLIADFEKVNPYVKVHTLKVGEYYLFPIYEKN